MTGPEPLVEALSRAFPSLSPGFRDLLAGFFSFGEVPAGTLVQKEGDRERTLLVVISGRAALLRSGEELGQLGPGDRTGELSFITAMPLPTSLVAGTPLALARLTIERFEVIAATHPDLARELRDELVSDLAKPRASTAGTAVLRGRTVRRRTEVSVRIQGTPRAVPVGTSVRHLVPERIHEHLVVAALVDSTPVTLLTPVTADCDVRPLATDHWEGQRIHRQSLALLLLEAGSRLEPKVRVELGASIGFGIRFGFEAPEGSTTTGVCDALARQMRELVREKLALREEWWTVDEARQHFVAASPRAASLLRTWRDRVVELVSYGNVHALGLGPLLPDTGELGDFSILVVEGRPVLLYGAQAAAPPLPSMVFPAVGLAPGTAGVHQAEGTRAGYLESHARRASAHVESMTSGQKSWLSALAIESVGALNDSCVSGNVSQLIRVSEGFQEKRIAGIADAVRDRANEVRVACIAGPSSSGKSTFIRRLEVQLQVDGVQPVGLSLDDYYLDRSRLAAGPDGSADYEALGALNLELLGDHLGRLLRGERVTTARFDFERGRSIPDGGATIELGPGRVLLLEGIHGLNPALLSAVPGVRPFRVFCCPLGQLPLDDLSRVHASDVRLVRRLVRDRFSRGATAADTIDRWPSVRAGERRHIFPFQDHADAVFDSSLIYELNVLKVFAERYLLEVPTSCPAHATAYRLIRLLDRFVTIYPDHVPPTSILREFIGDGVAR